MAIWLLKVDSPLWLCGPLRNGNHKPQHQGLILVLPHYVNASNMLLTSVMTALDENDSNWTEMYNTAVMSS